jgi:NAD(P)-dependent dehydrogenase (short-subunit alcohol dehydrogenase family)
MANEWAKHGINVNAIAPGYMDTNNTEAIRAEALRLGFDVCGFASATAPWPASHHLAEFVPNTDIDNCRCLASIKRRNGTIRYWHHNDKGIIL